MHSAVIRADTLDPRSATWRCQDSLSWPGDVRGDRVLRQQRVDERHDLILVTGVGRLEDRPELAPQPPQRGDVALLDPPPQPLPAVEIVGEIVLGLQRGVDEAGREIGVPNEVHAFIVRRSGSIEVMPRSS